MSFDPTLPTTLDRIRLIVGDTSGDPAVELFPDDTYAAKIAEHTNWKLAAAAMAEAVAVNLDRKMNSLNVSGDIAAGWRDRVATLRTITIPRLLAEAAAEDAAPAGVTSVALSRGGAVASEYRPDYRRLRR